MSNFDEELQSFAKKNKSALKTLGLETENIDQKIDFGVLLSMVLDSDLEGNAKNKLTEQIIALDELKSVSTPRIREQKEGIDTFFEKKKENIKPQGFKVILEGMENQKILSLTHLKKKNLPSHKDNVSSLEKQLNAELNKTDSNKNRVMSLINRIDNATNLQKLEAQRLSTKSSNRSR